MLEIYVPDDERFNENTLEFVTIKGGLLKLEHSLISISKWESKWLKPFLSEEERSDEELIDYVRCMTLNQVLDPNIYYNLSEDHIALISKYMNAPMTATIITSNIPAKKDNKVITSEQIYSWMFKLQIPMECQKWHLNRLLTQIEVCTIENNPQQKLSKIETMKSNAELNRIRREAMNTKG